MSQLYVIYVVTAAISVFIIHKFWTTVVLSPSLNRNWSNAKIWKQIDIVDVPSGPMPWARALVRSLNQLVVNTHDGYQKYSKNDRLFAIPTMWTGKPMIVLPPSKLHLTNRPGSELIGFWALVENLQLPYFIPDKDVIENVIHFEVSRKDMNLRNIERQVTPTLDEVETAFSDLCGVATDQWTTIKGWDVCSKLIARVALRTIVGDPLCRDERLLESTSLFANALFAATAVINCTPPFIRPILAPILALQAKYYGIRCQRVLVPLIKERIALLEDHKKSKISAADLPNDFLQWLVTRCDSHGPQHLNPNKIALRLLAINTMFVFGMSFVFSCAVVDICASPERADILQGIREEAERVAAASDSGRLDSKEAVDKLYRADSTIRESMRLSDVGVLSIPLDVMGNKPFDLGDGIMVPPGTRMMFPTQAMHTDPDNYKDPLKFEAFRFSREHEETTRVGADRQLMVTIDPGFLPWGYGKKACPGRWYVSIVLKLALSYLAVNYDVELVGDAPKKKALLNMMIPPTDVQLRVKRRRS